MFSTFIFCNKFWNIFPLNKRKLYIFLDEFWISLLLWNTFSYASFDAYHRSDGLKGHWPKIWRNPSFCRWISFHYVWWKMHYLVNSGLKRKLYYTHMKCRAPTKVEKMIQLKCLECKWHNKFHSNAEYSMG